jgi:hypothetical protein
MDNVTIVMICFENFKQVAFGKPASAGRNIRQSRNLDGVKGIFMKTDPSN